MTKVMTARAPLAALLVLVLCTGAAAQTPPAAPPDAKAAPAAADGVDPLAKFAWLEGCWRGNVNQREFREHWLPLRGNLLLGISHTVMNGKSLDYEYLRLEGIADGVQYVIAPSGQNAVAYKLTDIANAEGGDTLFVFSNPAKDFPQKITYRRGSDGWLYAAVEGKVAGADRQVIYPMRRIGCETGEFIRK